MSSFLALPGPPETLIISPILWMSKLWLGGVDFPQITLLISSGGSLHIYIQIQAEF